MKKTFLLFSVYDNLFRDMLGKNCLIDVDIVGGLAYGKSNTLVNWPNYLKIITCSEYINGQRKIVVSDYFISFIEGFERDCGTTFSDFLQSDRHFSKFDKDLRRNLALAILEDVVNFIKEENVELIFSEGCDDFFSFFLSKYCELSENLNFVYMIPARIGNRIHYSENLDTGPLDFHERYRRWMNSDISHASKFVDQYIENKVQPSYINSSLKYRAFELSKALDYLKYIRGCFHDKYALHYSTPPLRMLIQRFNRMYSALIWSRLPKLSSFNASEKYFVFPLQFTPEAATLVQGHRLNDMFILIQLVSKSLPFGVKLYVKEHKVSVGRRPSAEYRRIAELPNVNLIDEHADVHLLLRQSLGVITISSSMAIEALMHGKPVGIFGENYYSNIPGVFKFDDLSRLNALIQSMIDFSPESSRPVSALVATLLESSFDNVSIHPVTYRDLHKIPSLTAHLAGDYS
jgi:hypothetical protein